MRVPSTLFSLPSRSIVRRTLDPSSPCTHHTRSALAIYNAAVMLLAPAQHARTCHTNMSHEHVTQHASAENSRHSGIPVCATTPSVASFLVKCPSTLRPFLPPPPQAPHPSRTPALQSLALPLSPPLNPHSRLHPPPLSFCTWSNRVIALRSRPAVACRSMTCSMTQSIAEQGTASKLSKS